MKTIKLMALVLGVVSFTAGLKAVVLDKNSPWNETGYAESFWIPDGDYTNECCYIKAYEDTTTGNLLTGCINNGGYRIEGIFYDAKSGRCNIVNCDGILECAENCPAYRRAKGRSSLNSLGCKL